MAFDPINSMFTERYRPKKIKDMVGDFKEKVLEHLKNPMSVPHFLFYSKAPGTGKSTVCKAIINELGCDALIINSSDERKIEVVREKVKEFSMTKSSKEGIKRCVFLDEIDGMTKQSMDALRNIMETYAGNVFFVMTCNNLSKVIPPIQSRCILISFAYPEKKAVIEYLRMICEKEQIDYTNEGLQELVEKNHPSIRDSVMQLQDLKAEGKKLLPENVHPFTELYEEMWQLVKDRKYTEIRRLIMETKIDPRELNTFFWSKVADEEQPNVKLLQILCRNERDFAAGADSKVIFLTSIVELIK
jgi:replication factor C small subunit